MTELSELSPEQIAGVAITVGTLVALVGGWVRWWRPRIRRITADLVAARDTLLGRDSVKDSISGREHVPALPGIGVRMEHQEEQTKALTAAVTEIAQAVKVIADHRRIIDGHGDTLEEHAARIERLELNQVERVVARQESVQAFRAMEAAITRDMPGDTWPHEDPDGA